MAAAKAAVRAAPGLRFLDGNKSLQILALILRIKNKKRNSTPLYSDFCMKNSCKMSPVNFDLKQLEFCSDFTLQVTNHDEGTVEYSVHRVILAQLSDYFYTLFFQSSELFAEHLSKCVNLHI